MIKHNIKEIIDWALSFSLLEIATQKECIFLLHLGLEGITEVDNDPKGRFVSFKVTPSSRYSTREQLARGGDTFLKDYKVISKIKMREMKTK